MDFNSGKFLKYSKFILKYNTIHMLTSFKTTQAIQERLFEDSITAFQDIDLKNKSMLDIGTGAGIPGIPLKLVDNSLKLTLLESMQKRIKFLLQIQDFIDFKLIAGRAEEEYQYHIETFDIVTMRAVSKININLELAIQYVKIGGLIVLVKGPKAYEEIKDSKKATKILGLTLISTKEYATHDSTTVVVVYKKNKFCIKDYPRLYSSIKNKPLGE